MTYENEQYLDGYAAATVAPYGKGKIVMLGCLPAKETLAALVGAIAAEKGITPFAQASDNVSVICREGEYGTAYSYIETECEKGWFTVPFDGEDILSGKKFRAGETETIEPYGVTIIKRSRSV